MPLVVGVDGGEHLLLGLEVLGVDLDRRRVVLRRVAERLEVVVVGELARVGVALHERGEVLGVHVEVDGRGERLGVHGEGVLEALEAAGDLRGVGGQHLRDGRLELGGDGLADLGRHALEEGLQVGREVVRDVGRDDLLDPLAHRLAGHGVDLGEKPLGLLGRQVLLEVGGNLLHELGVVGVERARVLAPPGDEALRELAPQARGLLELVERERRVGELLVEDGREVRARHAGHERLHVHLSGDAREVDAHAGEVNLGRVEGRLEAARVEREGGAERGLVDREQALEVDPLAGLLLERLEALAGEDVGLGVGELLLHDLRARRALHQGLGEAVGVGDAGGERLGVAALVGPDDADHVEVEPGVDGGAHEVLVGGHVRPAPRLGVSAVGVRGADDLEAETEGVVVGEVDLLLLHLGLPRRPAHGGRDHLREFGGVEDADAVEGVVGDAPALREDEHAFVRLGRPAAGHHVVLGLEERLVVDHLVEDAHAPPVIVVESALGLSWVTPDSVSEE